MFIKSNQIEESVSIKRVNTYECHENEAAVGSISVDANQKIPHFQLNLEITCIPTFHISDCKQRHQWAFKVATPCHKSVIAN